MEISMIQSSTIDWLFRHFAEFGIMGLFGAGTGFLLVSTFIPSYLKEKAKNLASREDIEKITNTVETIKSANVKFLQRDSRIHERQLDKLSDLFQKLAIVQIDAQHCTRSFILAGENPEAYPGQLTKSVEDAYTTMLSCQLYFDDDLLVLVKEFFQKVRQSQVYYASAKDPSMPDGQSRADDWKKAGTIAFEELPKILEFIRQRAKAIIDVHQQA
jgi:hypothetical protein